MQKINVLNQQDNIDVITNDRILNLKSSIANFRENLLVDELRRDLKNIEDERNLLNEDLNITENDLLNSSPTWLPKANFSRTQTDLIAKSSNGEQVVFVDYFTNHELPSIQTENGLLLKGSLLKALAGPLTPGAYAQAAGEGPLSIGEVSNVSGTVKATRLDGTTVDLSNGDPVFQGDTIETTGSGSVGLVFLDKTTLSLSDSGKMVLDELVYDAASGTGSMAVDMLEGAFSFVSGEIAKTGPDSMKVTTPVATIGIRGTTVAGKAAVEGNENAFTLLQDSDGGVGQISVSNAGGTQVLAQVGATTSIASFNAPPPPPIILSAAEIQSNYGAALNVLPPTPAVAPQPQQAPPPQEEQQEEQQVEEEATEEEGSEEEAAAEGEAEAEGEEGELAEGEEGPPEGEEGELAEGEEGPPVGPDGEPLAEGEEGPPEGEAPPSEEQVAAREAFDTAMAAGATPEQAMAEAAEAGGFNQSVSTGPDGLAPPTSGPMDGPLNAPLGNMGMPMPGGMGPFSANSILNSGPIDPMGGPMMGGPMMGAVQKSLDIPVVKGTSGILILSDNEVRDLEEYNCIRCGKCVDACPIFLNPSMMGMLAKKGLWEDMLEYNVMDCFECASCSFVCP